MRVNVSLVIIFTLFYIDNNEGSNSSFGRPVALRAISNIGREKDSWILDATDLFVLPNGNVIVSDKLEYSLKEFNREGKLIASVGKRGGDPGEFRGPGPIAVGQNKLFVADFVSSRVQVFSLGMKFLFAFYTRGSIFSMKTDHEGNLWIGAYTGDKKRELFKYDSGGKYLFSVWLKNTTGDMFRDIFWSSTFPDGSVVVTYVVQNKIETWDENGNFIGQLSVPGVISQSPYKTISISRGFFSSERIEVPDGDLFMDCTTDTEGHIYLLMGEYSEYPFRDIYVLDNAGMLVSKLLLPHESSKIITVNDCLYAIESHNTLIGKYRILYDRAPRGRR